MGKKGENPSQLTDDDRDIVDYLFASSVVAMRSIIEKYRTPENYVRRYVLKSISSKKQFALGRIIINSFTQKYDGPLLPIKINKDLAEEEKYFDQEDGDLDALNKFLHPRDMNRVTNTLQKEGVFENIKGKKEIESQYNIRRRGRRRRGMELRTSSPRGGRPSIYKITQHFETIKKVMTKQEACNLLRDKLLRLKITYEFERFLLTAFFYVMKLDPDAVEKLFRLVTPWSNRWQLTDLRITTQSLLQKFNSFDDKQLETMADKLHVWSVETRPYDLNFVFFLAGL